LREGQRVEEREEGREDEPRLNKDDSCRPDEQHTSPFRVLSVQIRPDIVASPGKSEDGQTDLALPACAREKRSASLEDARKEHGVVDQVAGEVRSSRIVHWDVPTTEGPRIASAKELEAVV
jgi:hypothetical protein